MALTKIPVIDISAFYSADAARKAALARAIDKACREIGFLVVTGHRVPAAVTAGCATAARAFFDLPLGEKLNACPPSKHVPRGYAPLAGESLAALDGQAPLPDLKEAFDIGQIRPPPIAELPPEGRSYFAPNIWPSTPAGMRAAVESFYDALEDLAADLMSLFALALDLPADYFAACVEKGRTISGFRVLNYPDQPAAPLPGQLRAGPHTDYTTLTILAIEDKPGGLQARTPQGEWIEVPVVPGAFVVNVGDVMARWTNDRWVSTMHRVVNPPRDAEGSTRRQSLVFFHNTHYDTLIECLPSCANAANAAKYPPITAGEYLVMRFSTQNQPAAA
jgi:isopenicillin N synthase-like dioxygenase